MNRYRDIRDTRDTRDTRDIHDKRDNLWKESFKGFYKKHSRSLWLYICKICGDKSMADDIFQESFYRFVKAAPVKLNEHQQKAYLYKIAYRLFIDQKRRWKTEQKNFEETAAEEVFEMCLGKEREISLAMDMEKIFHLMKPQERALLWLAYVEGYSHIEIAGITGAGEKSIKVQLFRVKKKFADFLRRNGYDGANVVM